MWDITGSLLLFKSIQLSCTSLPPDPSLPHTLSLSPSLPLSLSLSLPPFLFPSLLLSPLSLSLWCFYMLLLIYALISPITYFNWLYPLLSSICPSIAGCRNTLTLTLLAIARRSAKLSYLLTFITASCWRLQSRQLSWHSSLIFTAHLWWWTFISHLFRLCSWLASICLFCRMHRLSHTLGKMFQQSPALCWRSSPPNSCRMHRLSHIQQDVPAKLCLLLTFITP